MERTSLGIFVQQQAVERSRAGSGAWIYMQIVVWGRVGAISSTAGKNLLGFSNCINWGRTLLVPGQRFLALIIVDAPRSRKLGAKY